MRAGDNYCPGILNAVPTKDGLLIRIRIPGGLIQAEQLSAIAKASCTQADGQVEITSRANIQLRAIRADRLPQVIEELTAAGLLPSPAHDKVRNIVASPLAGVDDQEICDTRPLVRLLDQRLLADPFLADLPPKFSMAMDGGGRWFSDEIEDLTLRAFHAENAVLWHLLIGGVSTGLAVAAEKAVACLLAAARSCLRASREFEITARGRALAADPAAWERIVSELSRSMVPFAPPQIFRRAADSPIGLVASKDQHFVHLVPSIALGRLSADQAREIAAVAADRKLDLRLAPWRGIVVGCVPKQDADQPAGLLRSMGLSLDGTDGYRGISACAGITGCDASLADVRNDAAALARVLAGRVPKAGWRVNVAGCEKQCAMRTRATVQLVAGEAGYRMTLNETSVSEGHSADRAIAAIASLHAGLLSEVSR